MIFQPSNETTSSLQNTGLHYALSIFWWDNLQSWQPCATFRQWENTLESSATHYKLAFWNTSFYKQTVYSEFQLKMKLKLTGLAFSSPGQWCWVLTMAPPSVKAAVTGSGLWCASPRFLPSQQASQPFFNFVVLLWPLHVSFPQGALKGTQHF